MANGYEIQTHVRAHVDDHDFELRTFQLSSWLIFKTRCYELITLYSYYSVI